jgi:hypothetical protein
MEQRMDPLTNLYAQLRRQRASGQAWPEEPPRLEDWLRYWNDEDTDLGNLRNFEHWLSCSAPGVEPRKERRPG